MAIDDSTLIEFISKQGELIGTVASLAATMSRMEISVLQALKTQEEEIRAHKEDDAIMKNHVIALLEWKNGTKDEPGAKKVLNDLVTGKAKFAAFMAGITIVGGVAGNKLVAIGEAMGVLK